MFCCEFCEIFKNTFFTEFLSATVSADIVDFRRNVFQKQSPVAFLPITNSSHQYFYEYCKTFKNTYFVIEKKNFFWKNICVFTKYISFAEKKVFIWKNKFYNEKKNFPEKSTNENVKNMYLISEIYFYTENIFVTNKI